MRCSMLCLAQLTAELALAACMDSDKGSESGTRKSVWPKGWGRRQFPHGNSRAAAARATGRRGHVLVATCLQQGYCTGLVAFKATSPGLALPSHSLTKCHETVQCTGRYRH